MNTSNRSPLLATLVLVGVLATACSTSTSISDVTTEPAEPDETTAQVSETEDDGQAPPDALQLETEPVPVPVVLITDEQDQVTAGRATGGGEPTWTLSSADGLVTVQLLTSHFEGGAKTDLVLRDAGDLPEFVSYVHGTSNAMDGDTETVVTEGRLEITAWEPGEGLVAGRLYDRGDRNPEFVFYIDVNDMSMRARLERGEVVRAAEIDTALSSGDPVTVFETIFLVAEREQFQPIFNALSDDSYPELSLDELRNLIESSLTSNDDAAVESALGLITIPRFRELVSGDPGHRARIRSLLAGGPASNPVVADLANGILLGEARGANLAFQLWDGPFLPSDLEDQAQIASVQSNWDLLFSLVDSAVPTPQLADEFAGYNEFANDGSVTLLCNGNAYWLDGDAFEVTTWATVDGEMVFTGPEPDFGVGVDVVERINARGPGTIGLNSRCE